MDIQAYRMLRQFGYKAWVCFVVVRSLAVTYDSDNWNYITIKGCADLVSRWPIDKAMAFRGSFMEGKI